VLGLTTAAGLWCVAAIGLAVGFGMYVVAVMATVIVLIILWLLDYIQQILPKTHYRSITLRRRWEPGCVAATMEHFTKQRLRVRDVSFQRTADLASADIKIDVAFVNRAHYFEFEQKIEKDPTFEVLAAQDW